MAFIETKSNQVIIDQAIASGDYIMLQNGFVPFYGSEFELTYSGSQLYIGTGMLIQNGIKVINDSPLTIDVGSTTSETTENKIYLKVDMSNPTNVTTVKNLSSVIMPSDDVFELFDNGIAYVEIGMYTLGTAGITGVVKTIKQSTIKKSDTEWSTLTLNTGWSNYGGDYATASFKLINGVVYIRGLVRNTAGSNIIIGTLPVGFRPTGGTRVFTTIGVAGAAGSSEVLDRVDITTDGVITVKKGQLTGFVSIELSFAI